MKTIDDLAKTITALDARMNQRWRRFAHKQAGNEEELEELHAKMRSLQRRIESCESDRADEEEPRCTPTPRSPGSFKEPRMEPLAKPSTNLKLRFEEFTHRSRVLLEDACEQGFRYAMVSIKDDHLHEVMGFAMPGVNFARSGLPDVVLIDLDGVDGLGVSFEETEDEGD